MNGHLRNYKELLRKVNEVVYAEYFIWHLPHDSCQYMAAIIVNRNNFDPQTVTLFREKENTDLDVRESHVSSLSTSSDVSQSHYLSLTRHKMGITPTVSKDCCKDVLITLCGAL